MIKGILKTVGIIFLSAIITKGVDKYMDLSFMKSLWQQFFVELWPIWIGLLIALIYWFIRFVFDVYKIRKTYRTLINWVEELEKKLNQDLEPRITKLEEPGKLELLRKTMFPDKNEKV